MKNVLKLVAAGGLAAAVLAPTMTTAMAGGGNWNRHRPHYNQGWNPGPAIFGGAVLGLTLGALANPYYYPPPPVYYAPYPPPPPYPASYTDEHMEWCAATYQSYNGETDTFVGFDGRLHRCVGPY